MELNLQQIVVLLGLFAGVWTQRSFQCFPDSEVEEAAQRKLQRLYPQPAEPAPSAAGDATCPLDLYARLPQSREYRERSLSPWRYESVQLPDHYPPSYVRAACLCSGCIQFNGSHVVESLDLVSVSLVQSRVFLRRELCEDGRRYRLVPVSLDVAVGCTCVRPTRSAH